MHQTTPETQIGSSARIAADRRLVVIQRNPTSGSGKRHNQLLELIRQLRAADFQVRLFASRERLDHYVSQHEVIQRLRCLVAAGGDGTVGSLVSRHAQFPIATLPLGTENLVARHLKIKCCGQSLARIIKDGRIRKFDTGQANGQTFLLMASVGIDADVVRRMNESRSGNIRHLSYLIPILSSFISYRFPRLSVYSHDGELLAEGSHVIATNIPEYGFRMQFAPAANPHDGRVDVRIFRRFSMMATILHAAKTWLGCKDHPSTIQRFQLQQFEIRSNTNETPGQIDGDPAEDCPLKISVHPQTMTLLVADKP